VGLATSKNAQKPSDKFFDSLVASAHGIYVLPFFGCLSARVALINTTRRSSCLDCGSHIAGFDPDGSAVVGCFMCSDAIAWERSNAFEAAAQND
jgi:hypothetical protein